MVENSIPVRATDLSRCVECPLRGYIAYNESPQYDYFEKGTIWGSLEHNARKELIRILKPQLKTEKMINTLKPESIIDKALYEIYNENPELIPYPPETVKEQISDLRNRLIIEETTRLTKLKYLMTTMPLDEAIAAAGIPVYTEILIRSAEQGINGKVDVIVKINDDLIPLDYKCSDTFMSYKRYDIQIGIYAILIESHFGVQVPYGIIYDAKRFQKIIIPITPELRNEIQEARKTHISIMEGVRPKGKPSKEICKECPFRRTCPEKWETRTEVPAKDHPAITAYDKLMASSGPLAIYDDEEVA